MNPFDVPDDPPRRQVTPNKVSFEVGDISSLNAAPQSLFWMIRKVR